MSEVSALLAALEADSAARLKWRVLALLGVSPLSLRGRLLTKRRALRCACHLVLDSAARGETPPGPAGGGGSRTARPQGAVQPSGGDAAGTVTRGGNPKFDMARFTALGGLSDGV